MLSVKDSLRHLTMQVSVVLVGVLIFGKPFWRNAFHRALLKIYLIGNILLLLVTLLGSFLNLDPLALLSINQLCGGAIGAVMAALYLPPIWASAILLMGSAFATALIPRSFVSAAFWIQAVALAWAIYSWIQAGRARRVASQRNLR